MATEAKNTAYGPRKLGQEAWEKQQERQKRTSRDGTTVYGKRKAGASRPDTRERLQKAKTEEKGGAVPWGELSIGELEAKLKAEPGLLDIAADAELQRAEPRKGAAKVLLAFENVRAGGARDTMVRLLSQVIG